MFQGFNIEKLDFKDFADFYKKGYAIYDETKKCIDLKLSFLKDGILDAEKIQSDWFPDIKADVFLSHSHADKNLAIAFSGWLKEKFGLCSFVDSCLWGYCDELLKIIDNKFCKNDNGIYDYKSRNVSTGIVHMILMNAITKMIDKTECLMFLNTPNSIVLENDISQKTYSPWIFSELETSRFIRKIIPNRLEKRIKDSTKFLSAINESQLIVAFPANTSHLIKLDNKDLTNWCKSYSLCNNYLSYKKECPLNYLYKMKNVIK